MRVKSIIAALLLVVVSLQTAQAQHAMQVWQKGKFVLFHINNVDSVRFVTLVTDIYLSPQTLELKVGETGQLTVSAYPVDADDKAVMWSSSASSVATVDANGLVKAAGAGTAVVSATATDGSGVKAECQVTVTKAGGDDGFLTCPNDHHPHAIDLGLPSGTKWCCCNVGASTPEGYGGHYAWGETSEKSYYGGWDTYFDSQCEKYHNGGQTELLPEDDAATVNMGAPWRMPTTAQQQELSDNCSSEWTQQNGVNGRLFTGPNGGQIFLPAAGYRWKNDNLDGADSFGNYWSSSLFPGNDGLAYGLHFDLFSWSWDYDSYRYNGLSVRAVRP